MVLETRDPAPSQLDRRAEERARPDLLMQLWQDDATVVVTLRGDRAPVAEATTTNDVTLLLPSVAMLRPPASGSNGNGPPEEALVAYLGRADGRNVLLVALAQDADLPAGMAQSLLSTAQWAGLRDVGIFLSDLAAELFTVGLALAGWHERHPQCSQCGAATEPVQAGWSRRCPRCGAEHYPRTDPAVIMSVVDADGRILLGRQQVWPERRYSVLAGFVEPGESLEDAVRREVAEEAGITVTDVAYCGSQPWPFPASLMVGFRARAVSTQITLGDGELAQAQWWTRAEFTADVTSGVLLLPHPISIARRLIEAWYGQPLPSSAT